MANGQPKTIPYGGRTIYDPEDVGFVERDDFIKSLASVNAVVEPAPLEQSILAKWKAGLAAAVPKEKLEVSAGVARMARDYARYLKQGARLPKFSRWASGMFPSDKDLANTLARVGQVKAAVGELQFSARCFDLMRAGVSPHFGSCFQVGGVGGDSLIKIASTAPGIGIAFSDDENGVMKARTWIYHATRKADGKDIVVLASYPYGRFDEQAAANALKARGFIPYKAVYGAGGGEAITYQNMGQRFYNDTNLWGGGCYAKPL